MNWKPSGAVLAAAVTLAGPFSLPAHAQDPVPPSPACSTPGVGIEEARFVTLGGIEQWVTILGEDCTNPIVVFLHGGPGNPLSPFAGAIYSGWEGDFTLVQWDQRGTGRTFGRNPVPEEGSLTVELMTEDGLELTDYLSSRLGQEKVFLVGGSWGSILGIHMVRARPERFHAYVGLAQIVGFAANPPASYAKVLELARAAGDDTTLEALGAIGSPPWEDPRSPGVLRRSSRALEAVRTDPAPDAWWVRAPEYDSPDAIADELDGEDLSYLEFVGFRGDGMFSRVDLPRLGMTFQVPVFLVQGAEDLVTVPEVTRGYFEAIAAPRKEYVLVPRAGHDPNQATLDAVHAILLREVALLAP